MIRQRIGLLSDIAVIAVAALLGVIVVKNYVWSPTRPIELLKAGDTLSDLGTIGPNVDHKKRLLLVLKKGCPYCEGSAPLYKELAQLEQSGQTDVKMVAIFEDPPDVARQLLEAEDVKMDVVGGVSPLKLRIAATPTLILVDDRGRVLKVWEGLLSRKAEEELKGVIRGGDKI